MPWFEGTHTETRPLSVPPEQAAAHFGNPSAIVAATEDVESHTIDGTAIHFVMTEQDHGVVKFKADFTCTYEVDGPVVRWSSAPGGTLDQSGEARFEATAEGCEVHYTETVKIDLNVPAMTAPMLKPVIAPVLAHEIKGYLDRMITSLHG